MKNILHTSRVTENFRCFLFLFIYFYSILIKIFKIQTAPKVSFIILIIPLFFLFFFLLFLPPFIPNCSVFLNSNTLNIRNTFNHNKLEGRWVIHHWTLFFFSEEFITSVTYSSCKLLLTVGTFPFARDECIWKSYVTTQTILSDQDVIFASHPSKLPLFPHGCPYTIAAISTIIFQR